MEFLAIDLGAGSGRAIVGTLANNRLTLDEVHRFPNALIHRDQHVYWDFPALLGEVKRAIVIAYQKYPELKSMAIDTWGVDFGLLNEKGELIGFPHSYRDERTKGMLDKAFQRMDKHEIYRLAGNQFMEINTAYQLLSMVSAGPHLLREARQLLFMPDLFNYHLTGAVANEYTIASTSNLLNATMKSWSKEIVDGLGLPMQLLGEIVHPGTVLGTLSEEVCRELSVPPIPVVAVGSHDTASAVAVVARPPGKTTAYISSGTWSLMGLSLDKPCLTREAMEANFTNEGGVRGEIRYLRNITGLWILEGVMREWRREEGKREEGRGKEGKREEGRGKRDDGYRELLEEAGKCQAGVRWIDVDDPCFSNPTSMTHAITSYCRASGQPIPVTRGEFVRTILDSMANKYKEVFALLESTTGRRIDEIQVVGGGSQNQLLNQLTANACGVPVVAGPVEATAIGNILVQAEACGVVTSNEQYNQIIIDSFSLKRHLPT